MQLILLFYVFTVALASSPSGTYAPSSIQCPSGNLVRPADSISPEEQEWLNGRVPIAQANLITFLQKANLEDFDAEGFVTNAKKNITIGTAFSGGGYRAMFAGAGQLAALDSRNYGADEAGLGGLLQASTYLVGLSGGSWLVGTVAINNFISIDDITSNKALWDITYTMFAPGGWNFIKTQFYWASINISLLAKQLALFRISITDIWGRALAFQMFNTFKNGGDSVTWSQIADDEEFSNFNTPYPIVVADGRVPGTLIINENSTIFEITPHELGSWDPSLYLFTKTKYLGTKTTNGVPNGRCIGGFDNAGFIIGTSSSLFNQVALYLSSWTSYLGLAGTIIGQISNHILANIDVDTSLYKPNPFYRTQYGDSYSILNDDTLFLVDGGEDLQNVPLAPLLQPQRGLDIIFAYDNSADTSANWPNGASLVATFQRQFSHQGNSTFFPYVPDVNSFRNEDLTAKPAFFGCDANALKALVGPNANTSSSNFQLYTNDSSIESVFDIPLIVYTANRPFSYYSNTSTFKLDYSTTEKQGLIKNGFETATRLNSTLDLEWGACVGCAIIRREQERQGVAQSDQCKRCFERYCWNGDTDTSTPGDNFSLTSQTVADDGSILPDYPNSFK